MRKEIIQFVEKNSFQSLDGDENEEGMLEFTTRAHGNVGDEQHSEIDVRDAHLIGRKVVGTFDGVDRYEVETCDEWVDLTIYFK